VTLEALWAALGSIFTAALGVVLVIREFRRRDRRESLKEIEQCNDEVHALRADFLNYRSWSYGLAMTLTGMGVIVPPAPPPVHAEEKLDDPRSGPPGPEAEGPGA
jgi:hypothetical protein